MKDELFSIKQESIQLLIPNLGYCYATNEITIKGMKIGYMYREMPEDKNDSGWRFFSGNETQDYIENPDNIGIYDVNTIANYDNSIIPYLHNPVGICFEKTEKGDLFQIV